MGGLGEFGEGVLARGPVVGEGPEEFLAGPVRRGGGHLPERVARGVSGVGALVPVLARGFAYVVPYVFPGGPPRFFDAAVVAVVGFRRGVLDGVRHGVGAPRVAAVVALVVVAVVVVAEGGEQGLFHPQPEQIVVDGIVVIDKGGKFRNSMQKLLHYLRGQRGEFPAQDAGPLSARAGPDAVQKFAHRFLVLAGVRPVRCRGDRPARIAGFTNSPVCQESCSHHVPFWRVPATFGPTGLPCFCRRGRLDGRRGGGLSQPPLEGNLPGLFDAL